MPQVIVEINSCKECPHFRTENPWSSDGWDWMEDWHCMKMNMSIAKAVEWHDEKHIKIPDWCPIKLNETVEQ